MKYIMCSRHFPKGHPKAGQETYFVEKIWNALINPESTCDTQVMTEYLQWGNHEWWEIPKVYEVQPKHHTIRPNNRFKPGETISLRVWSGSPYRSKQIEFAQVEVKKVWNIEISEFWFINGVILEHDTVKKLAANDGLAYDDFVDWFNIHPKKKDEVFRGQIICWSPDINY